ncbi:MAG: chromosomal replication initiator protein DnaA [Propionibacteriaceae bacterium]|nr:chromosomal replication initiator protein DnaA [Propionibacteriaceae bacterium]
MNTSQDSPPGVADAWQHILSNVDSATRGWLTSTKPVALHDSLLILAVPNEFIRDRVESRIRTELEMLLTQFLDQQTSVATTIDPNLEVQIPAETEDKKPKKQATARVDTGYRLNPKYTFDTFVIGESNRFAHATAVAVAESPGKSYNPLLIYGDSGLGKTHLLHAIGHYILNYYPDIRVKYVSTEEFLNDFINAISQNRTAEFRRTYRDKVDVLLMDDIQFLEQRIQTQEEFFHTFNALHNAQKQIVMTSDRPPRLLEALEPRLRSRFESGLMSDVQPPSLETRIAILRRKVEAEQLVADSEVLEFIAGQITTNIRELEGALIRITAFATLNHRTVDLELAKIVLKDLIPEGGEVPVSATTIKNQIADYYNVSVEELCGASRSSSVVVARQIAMYLCRELTDLSLPKIGEEFGGRDHTTVLYAVRKISDMLPKERSFYNQVTEITNRIRRTSR